MGINRDLDFEEIESLGGREGAKNPFKKSKRGGQIGHKSSGSKSILEGAPTRNREHLCWGTKCESDATRLAGIPTTDPEAAKIEPISFVPLCQSCAGKAKRRAQKKNLPEPLVTPMTRYVNETYKLQVEAPSAKPDAAVEKFIAQRRLDGPIDKQQKQYPGGQFRKAPRSGNPNTGGHPLFKTISDIRRRKEAEELTLGTIKKYRESQKNKNNG